MRLIRPSRSLVLVGSLLASVLAGTSMAQDSPLKAFRDSFQQRITEKDLDGAAQLIDENTDLQPEALAQFRLQIGSMLMRDKRGDEAAVQFTKALEATYAVIDENPRPFAGMLPAAAMMLRQSNPTEADQWIEKGLTALGSKLSTDQLSDTHSLFAQILRSKLSTPDKDAAQQAKEKLLEFVASCESIYAGESDPSPNARIMLQVWTDVIPTLDEADAATLFDKIQALAQSQLKRSPNGAVLQAYASSVGMVVSRNARTNPDLAAETLASATSFMETIESEDATIQRVMENFTKNAERLTKTIDSARALIAMIGKPAPAIDPLEWVNGEPETLESLRGKVVLLDFWAVWCGPCIATFPHLKHLDAQYGSQGLTIIGVTRQYNFSWDDATASASRAEEEVSLEDEMAMLEKFISKYELTHRSMVTPKESKMQAEYQVTGIPHAVLIDKQGNVRLVKVGSGEKNAEEIEAMVQTLLAE